MIPYARQWLDKEDIEAVVEVLRSDWLTTGPMIDAFERAVVELVGARQGVAVSSGTAALHAAMFAAGIGQGDEVILPSMTFVSTANSVVFQGGTPVFADVNPDTLLIDPDDVAGKITRRTKAVIAVDYAGQPCDYDALRAITDRHRLLLIADACHALGAQYKGKKVGTLADLTAFSFHPVKHITTGEGGMVVTDNAESASKMYRFRNHGINADQRQRTERGTWHYEMADLGYNYRITDFQCALGISQLKKLSGWITRRQQIADRYHKTFSDLPGVQPLEVLPDVSHAYHLFVVRLDCHQLNINREKVFTALRERGIGVNVHYLPVHLHPFYRQRFGTGPGLCPVAEAAYERLLSLPIFPRMTDKDVDHVLRTVNDLVKGLTGR
jgi:perosamine synthetase